MQWKRRSSDCRPWYVSVKSVHLVENLLFRHILRIRSLHTLGYVHAERLEQLRPEGVILSVRTLERHRLRSEYVAAGRVEIRFVDQFAAIHRIVVGQKRVVVW